MSRRAVAPLLAQAVFGGTVPTVAVAPIGATGYALAPALYLAAAGIVSFAVVPITNVLPEEITGSQ
jgi:hypothetical protein